MTAPPPVRSQSSYFWLCLALSATVFYGFSITYFQPMLAGAYPDLASVFGGLRRWKDRYR